MNPNVVTFTLLRFEKLSHKWWAFAQMGRSKELFQNIDGLTFSKMVGSGAGNGFSIFPNFGVYALLAVWENEAKADAFFNKHPTFQSFKAKTSEICHFFNKTAMTHGTWDAKAPFVINSDLSNDLPLAVLTRATIKWRYLVYFWKFVPRTSRSVYDYAGRLFSIGIGELPLIQQATFSLWENAKKMTDFAYKSKFHSEVVQKTRKLGWYQEELFARFHPYRVEGAWKELPQLNELFPFKV